MINKSRSILWLTLALLFICPARADKIVGGAWEGSPVGQCFSMLDEYLQKTFGDQYKDDENIKIVPVEARIIGKKRIASDLVWVMDTTPGINITRVLFIERNKDEICALLYAPLSSYVSFRLDKKGGLPLRVVTQDTPPAGLAANRVVYAFNTKAATYSPESCQKISSKGARRVINCNQAFLE